MSKRRKPVVGETLLARRVYRHPVRVEVTEIRVERVGRLYFDVSYVGHGDRRYDFGTFMVDTWQWKTSNDQWDRPIFIAENQQQLDDYEEECSLRDDLAAKLREWSLLRDMSLEKLRALKTLLYTP